MTNRSTTDTRSTQRGLGRREFLGRGGKALAAAGLGPVLGAAALPQCEPTNVVIGPPPAPSTTTTSTTSSTTSTTTSTTTTAAPPPATARAGYNLFHWQAVGSKVLQGIRAMRPSLIRWSVNWDAYQPDGPTAVDWRSHRVFFELLRDIGCQLVVQVTAGIPVWARPDFTCMYPKPGSYRQFVEPLAAEVDAAGVDAIWSAWNEPDLRWLIGSQGAENYLDPWCINIFDLVKGTAPYSGGARSVFAEMHWDRSRRWASGGVFTANWVPLTAQYFQVIDLHEYFNGRSVDSYLSGIRAKLATYDAVRPGLPFFIGECATTPDPRDWYRNDSPQELALHRERHTACQQAFGSRYLGMTTITSAQPLDAEKGWWVP